MYHSIKFGSGSTWKDTWEDWHLIPSPRPSVASPEVQEKMIEIPGRDGLLDATEFLTGSPRYLNRTGTWDFYVMHEYWNSWAETYTTIMAYLHGKKMQVILEDDPNYYYEGRLTVQPFSSQNDYSKISINYNLQPYKTHVSMGTKTF